MEQLQLTSLELVLSLLIIVILNSFSLKLATINEHKEIYFINRYLLKQSEAMALKEKISIENDIRFNAFGNVNLAKTLDIDGHQIVISLGTGKIYEK